MGDLGTIRLRLFILPTVVTITEGERTQIEKARGQLTQKNIISSGPSSALMSSLKEGRTFRTKAVAISVRTAPTTNTIGLSYFNL